MKILVTGGTGFTGTALVKRLAGLGHTVRSLDYQQGIMYDELSELGVELITGSVADRRAVDEATQGVDFVFHLAAAFRELHVPDAHYFDVNVNGTRYVMEAARKYNVQKVVYCSTQGVHGHIHNPPGNEASPIAPEDYYQQTKYEGEEVVQEFIAKGMNACIIRPMAIYGPGDPGRFLMIYKWAQRGFFPMFGDGKTFYQPLYIDNLVDAFVLTLQPEVGSGGTYLIGDEAYLPIEELVIKTGRAMGKEIKVIHLPLMPLVIAGHLCEKICKPFGIAPPIFPRRVDWYRQVRAFSIDKAKRELGYFPKIDIDEGLRRTAEWYRQKGFITDAFASNPAQSQ